MNLQKTWSYRWHLRPVVCCVARAHHTIASSKDVGAIRDEKRVVKWVISHRWCTSCQCTIKHHSFEKNRKHITDTCVLCMRARSKNAEVNTNLINKAIQEWDLPSMWPNTSNFNGLCFELWCRMSAYKLVSFYLPFNRTNYEDITPMKTKPITKHP